MFELYVKIPPKGIEYPIKIGSNMMTRYLGKYSLPSVFTIIDKNILKLYPAIEPKGVYFTIDASEASKSLETVERILLWLKDNGAIRDSMIVSIGGGVTGDIAGFVAGIYMRGIRIVQVPTTLLAMVDSSVGGKTGVNMGGIKNNIGVFHQPSEVVIDTAFLKGLTDSEFLNGLTESIKIGAVVGSDLFYFIIENKRKILLRDDNIMGQLISKSCYLKASVVELDERENGIRKLLNFGHTIAHAIETDSGNSIQHGYAVAMGMVYESLYALKCGFTDQATYDLLTKTLLDFGYDIKYKPKNTDVFLNALKKDKKATCSGISLALTGEGLTGKIVDGIEPESLMELFSN